MDELTHDPSEFIRGLQQLLISDKKKIAFLFGAGTSLAKKCDESPCIPAIGELTQTIEADLSKIDKYKEAINEIKEDEIGIDKYNIETLLSNLEQKLLVIGKGNLNGLDSTEISDLITNIKKQIRKKVSVHEKIEKNREHLENSIQCDFAEWINRVDRNYGIEIFTLNYDYLLELGLESKNVPYYDGFTGSFLPFFNSESVEDFRFLARQTKLWKIHGSLGWHFDEELGKVLRKDSSEQDILIYPSTLKYSDSKKQPYISFLDRLSNFLKHDDSVLIICGYSFGDEHINERIMTALNNNISSNVIALYYDIIWQEEKEYGLKEDLFLTKLAKTNSKLSVYGCKNAVIGCQYGKWKLNTEPDDSDKKNISLYFNEDPGTGKAWTGEGELILPDFCKFVNFLSSWIIENKLDQGIK